MESLKKKKERVRLIFEILDPLYTYEKTALEYHSPLELLIATILSAQCTDRQVNEVTKTLFKKYRRAEDYVNAPVAELEKDIRPTGFYRNKAKSLKGCCRTLLDVYSGVVPSTMEELLKLPGVGRKTANCVLGAVFNVPGVVVDTHVKRHAGWPWIWGAETAGICEGWQPVSIICAVLAWMDLMRTSARQTSMRNGKDSAND